MMEQATAAMSGVVAANPEPAAAIGQRMLEAGGNAMDAAVAASLACCMLRPSATGVGGYVCAAVVRDGRTGTVWSVDADGMAPAAAHPTMYAVLPPDAANPGINEHEYFCGVRDDANLFGPLSVTVPGMMAGMGIIHERWGRLPWPRIIEPALALIEDGFPFGDLARSVRVMETPLRRFPASVAHLMPGGALPGPDDLCHRPEMEKTLRRLAAAGWRDFYDGEVGRQIADAVRDAGGILTREDMARYQPRVTPSLTTSYHGAAVHTAILPNGGMSCLQALNLLEALDLPSEDTADYWHRLAEVLKLTWRDRLTFLGDPDFADVPVARLLSKSYAAERVHHLRECPAFVDCETPDLQAGPGAGTLHVSAADADGNLVAMTISQGNTFGSCFTVPGTGIILGHGMCRLDPRPGWPNSVAPRKRPLNNVAPLLVEQPGRVIAIGLPGGRKIVSVMARAAQLLIDRQYTAQQAADAPRLHVEIAEPVSLQDTVPSEIAQALQAMGHRVSTITQVAGVMNGAEFLMADGNTRAGSGGAARSAQTDFRQMGAAGGQ